MGTGEKRFSVILVSLLCSYVTTVLALLLLAFLLYALKCGDSVAKIGVILIYLGATFVGGYFTGKKLHTKKYLWGLFVGALYFFILWMVSLAIPGGERDTTMQFLASMLLCIGGGMLGGMFG